MLLRCSHLNAALAAKRVIMDIFVNQPIKYLELNSFFKEIFSENKFFLLYEGENDWEDIQDERIVFQYHLDDEKRNGFDSGIDVFQKGDDILPIIENLSFLLSRKFSCSVFCDASRLVMKEHNPYYSLLFESGRVYLADDYIYEDTGQVTKIIELTYELPKYKFG